MVARAHVEPDDDVDLGRHPHELPGADHAGGEDELTELVTRRDVAQFLYFGGSVRGPELADLLVDAADRFEKVSPATVVDLRAAVGLHAARAAKTVETDRGKRRVVRRPADMTRASNQLRAALDAGVRRNLVDAPTAAALRSRVERA